MSIEVRRTFNRYKSRSKCEISLDTKTYKGKLVNYSDGICAVIENIPQLIPGTQADIRIPDLEMEFKGEVVWAKKLGNALRAGFRRVDNFRGCLKDFNLADILIGLQRSTKTGVLRIESGAIVKKIFIKNGDMIFADSNNKNDRLKEVLFKKGKITLEEYNQASNILEKTGERLGKILVKLGCLTPRELFQEVQHQIEEIILSIFTIEEGKFEFQEEPPPAGELITLRVSAANLVYRGIKRNNNFQQIKKICPPLDAVLKLSPNPLSIFQDFNPDDYDRRILSRIDGKKSIKTIFPLSPSRDFDTIKAICAFLSIGLVEVKSERAPNELLVEEVLGEPDEETTTEFTEKMEELFNKCETLGYYDVLDIEKEASIEEIKKAYYKISKQYHPDRLFSMPPDIDMVDIKEKLKKILIYITKAYITLSDPKKRREYNRKLSLKVLPAVSGEKPMLRTTPKKDKNIYLKGTEHKLNKILKEFKNREPRLDTVKAIHRDTVTPEKNRLKRNRLYITTVILVAVALMIALPLYRSFDKGEAQYPMSAVTESKRPDAEGIKFKPQNVIKGDTIQAKAIINSNEILSNVVEITNAPPEISMAIILPEVFESRGTLSVEAAGSDIDGDEVTISYEWTKNREPAGNSKRIEGTLKRGDRVSVKITPFDGEDYGQPKVLKREILNAAPMIIEHEDFIFDGKIYSYQVKAIDPDGDPLTYSIRSGSEDISIDLKTGMITWVVPQDLTGGVPVTVFVRDGYGGEITQQIILAINPRRIM